MVRRFVTFIFLLLCATGNAAVTGPADVQPGILARFESDIAGDCMVYPVGQGSYALDSNGITVYFASPTEGDYTLIFFGIRDGKPEICTYMFRVSGDVPDVKPEPQPEPQPQPVKVDITDAEKAAVRAAMQSVIDGINAGTIRTPQGARYALKNDLIRRVGTCSASGCRVSAGLESALKTWEKEIDIETLDGIKAGFGKILETLK